MSIEAALVENPLALRGRPASEVVDFLATVGERLERLGEPTLARLSGSGPVRVIADTHGDYVAAQRAFEEPLNGVGTGAFVALGDYLDRSTRRTPHPTHLPDGSLWDLTYLLAQKMVHPRDVVLLQGNHESARRLPVPGPSYLRELRELYSPGEALQVWEQTFAVVERLPLAALTENGVFLAHGGVPPPDAPPPSDWKREDLRLLEGLVWSDPAHDFEDRGVGFAFDAPRLATFLESIGASMLLRGHDPKNSGKALYGGRCLTLQTSDLFRHFGRGGVLMAEIPAVARVRGAKDVPVWDLSDDGWTPYPVQFVD